jgi:hypothetical protein
MLSSIESFGKGKYRMRAKKEMKHDLYKCSVLGEDAHVEMLYEILTNPDRERLMRFDCAECRKCGVGTQITAWETKVEWEKCAHPLSPKP